MADIYIHEAVLAGAREGVKAGLVVWVVTCLYDAQRRAFMLRAVLSGGALSMLCLVFLMDDALAMQVRLMLPRLSGYVFFLFFFAASIVLLRFHDVGLGARSGKVPILSWALAASVMFVFWVPDVLSVSIYLDDLNALKQRTFRVYANALTGFILMLSLGVYVSSLRRVSAGLSRYLGLGQLLIILSLVKLFMSGTKGLSGASLLSTVQGGVMKFVHDLVHQTFLYLLVPDHPMLKTTVWNFIGFLFGSTMSTILALSALLVPPVVYIYFNITSPVPLPDGALTGAEKRMHRTAVRASRRRLSVPVALFIVVVIFGWYSGGSDSAALYMPTPKPVIAEGGVVSIPLSSPGEDLLDGSIHKYSVLLEGKSVVLLIMKKTDGKLSVSLDACEICPPDGYGQRQGYVVCVYCMTPIPVDTLGRPGGCNPIPLNAKVIESDVRVSLDEISSKWKTFVTVRQRGEDK